MGGVRLLFLLVGSIVVPPLRLLTERRLRHRSEMWQMTDGRTERTLLRNISGLSIINIEYSYSAGAKHEGLRLVRYVRPKAAQETAARFPAGSSVTVRYNPSRPEDSVLLLGEPTSR